jgi:glucan phosphoethanolaminetransferase (alkaline phosphatase superfamily)
MEQIFKIVEMLMGFSVMKSQAASKQLLVTVRKLVILVLIALGAMALFCVGIAIVVANLAQQMEHPILIGSILSLISVITLVVCLQQKSWMKPEAREEEQRTPPKGPGPVEQALALLITDIVMERQNKRKSTEETSL